MGEKKTPFTKFEINNKLNNDSDSIEDPDNDGGDPVDDDKYSFPSNYFNRSTIKKLTDQDIISEVVGTMKNDEMKS